MGWHPANNHEVKEYNKYLEGWRMVGYAEIDAQTAFLNAQNEHLRKQPLMFSLRTYPYQRQMHSMVERLQDIKCVNASEAAEIAGMQRAVKLKEGLDFEYALYRFAFERISVEDRARLVELYADVETDHQYLDQEEVIANLLAGKDKLTTEAKETLAALVADRCYNSFAREYQFFHYFACIPIKEVALRVLAKTDDTSDQETDDEELTAYRELDKAMENHAKENGATIETLLKESCLAWLNDDLFDRHTPLVLSSDSELFTRWLAAKTEARVLLEKHIENGELAVRQRLPDESRFGKLLSTGLYDAEIQKAQAALELMRIESVDVSKGEFDEKIAFASFSDRVITGKSLYAFAGEYAFVADFKRDVDRYDPNLGLVYAKEDADRREHLDQELLIADRDKNGKLTIFSPYGIALHTLDGFLEASALFKEEHGMLAFKNAELGEAFIAMKEKLVEGYATFLSFEELFERLSVIYEVDLTHRVLPWRYTLESYLDDHNEELRRDVGEIHDEAKSLWPSGPVLKIDPELLIEKESIKPSQKKIATYFEKFEELFGSEFGTCA